MPVNATGTRERNCERVLARLEDGVRNVCDAGQLRRHAAACACVITAAVHSALLNNWKARLWQDILPKTGSRQQ
eukprot:6131738-Alexandrium_andersonii.AAC.1